MERKKFLGMAAIMGTVGAVIVAMLFRVPSATEPPGAIAHFGDEDASASAEISNDIPAVAAEDAPAPPPMRPPVQTPSNISDDASVPNTDTDYDNAVHDNTLIAPALSAQAALPAESSSLSLPCTFPSVDATSSFTRKIILNEIAWMGGTDSSNAEWIELKNISGSEILLRGWRVENVSGKITADPGDGARIEAGGFFLLARGSTTFPYAHAEQASYSGDLKNSGDDLAVIDPSCGISDAVFASVSGWPAGDNTSKRTMERDASGGGWHTSVAPGGSPGEDNSVAPPSRYRVDISFEGSGAGSVASVPAGLSCGPASCSGMFDADAAVTFTAKAAANGIFDGWSGACTGKGTCSFSVDGNASVTAEFHIPQAAPPLPADGGSQNTPVIPTPEGDSSDSGHVLIAAVQIAGTAASNDFIRLYNAGTAAVDLDGWKLKKRSQTGTEYSLRTLPQGAAIAPGGYFVWANSSGGFAAAIGADASSTETIAADNSAALIDASGNIVDAVAWGTGTGQYGEGDPFPTNPAAGQVLERNSAGNALSDSGNNAADFILSNSS